MSKITITRKLECDTGHRLMGHESKCRNVHGHRYVFEVTCEAPKLDDVGRVIDFSVVKAEVGTWIDDNWDHAFVFQAGDPIETFLRDHNQRRFMMMAPPTAENMGALLLGVARDLMQKHGITVTRVRCHETPNCVAEIV
jgi:6-pyruvoyltetrahydropterin/6-carboxytetrahydropterin synthase